MYRRFNAALFGTKRRMWLTIVVSLLVVGLLSAIAPSVDDVKTNSGDGPSETAQSMEAKKRLQEAFPTEPNLLPAVVVLTSDSAKTTEKAAHDVLADLAERDGGFTRAPISPVCTSLESQVLRDGKCIPGSPEGTRSEDGKTVTIVVPIVGDATEKSYRDDIDALREDIAAIADNADNNVNVETHLTGPAGIVTDTVKVFSSGDRVLMLGTILLVLVILLLVYRSPVLAVLPLLAVGVAMRLAQSVGALLADAGAIEISSQTASIMTVLLFGVGTDYALIINARYREALATQREKGQELDRNAAMVDAMGRTGEVLASSAGTIILAMMALLFTKSPALQGFGPYLAIGVASMAIVAAVFLPALFIAVGKAAFWPGGYDKALQRVDSKMWTKVAHTVDKKPKAVLAAGLALLIVMSLGALNYKESFNFLTGFRVDTDSAAGQEIAARDIGAGEIAPTTLLIEGKELNLPQVQQAAEDVAKKDSADIARISVTSRDVTDDGETARMTVVLNQDPYITESMEALEPISNDVRDALKEAGASADTEVTATGETAELRDVRADLDRDIKMLVPVMIAIVAIVLAVLLKSLLAPLYLAATLLLSFAATMGLTVLIALNMQGDEGIGNRVTAYILVFLIALGVDYTIFVMSRLRQELKHHDVREAMKIAVARTGGVVSSAGLILAATFAVLMTQPIRELYQFGLGLALGILLDTFVVRPFIVPAIVRLIGDNALWPTKPSKLLAESKEQPQEEIVSAEH